MEENKNIQSEQQQNQLQTSNALPNMPRLRDKPGIMGFTGFGTTPHQEEDTLTLEYPAFKEQINKALQAGENRDNIRKELAALESVALTQYSYDEVNQFLGRNSDTVPKLIDEMMRQKDNSYIEIMKTDMPEKQVRDILWLAHESGITPGVLLLNPEFAAKIKKDMEGDNPNFLYAGGRNLFSQLQESNVDKYSLAIAEIEQQMENDDILLSEGRRLYEGMLKTKPYLSNDEYRDLARNAFQQQIKNLEEKAKIDAQDAEKWRTQILRPDKYQNWWKYQLYEAIANAGFTGKSMLAGALTYNVGNFIMPGLGAALTPIVDAFMAIDEARSEGAQAYKEYFMRYGDKKKALEVGHNVEAVNRIFLPISNFVSSRILEKWDDTLFERWGKKILKGQDFAPTLGRRLTARFAADYLPGLVNALPEGVEEVVQEITSTVAQEDEIDYNRLKEAFTQGVFSGALLGWGRTSIGNVYDYAKEQRYHQNFSREKKFLQKINPKLFSLFKIGNDISNGRLNVDDVIEQTPVVFIPKSQITEEIARALNIESETIENNEEIINPEERAGVSETPAAINVAEIAGEDATAIESEIVPEDEEIAIKKEDWEKFAAENPEQAQALQNYVREGTQGITAQEKIEQATREIIEAVNEAPEIKEQAERLEQEFIQAGRPQNEARALAQVAGTIAGAINKQYGIPVNQTMNLEAVKGNEQNQANSRQAESHNQRRLFNNAEERLKADSQAWSNLIDRFITNKLSREEQKNLLPVMQTPLVFNLVGVELLPIEIRLENINKIIKRKHLVSPEILKQIPKAITDPIMIFKSEHDTAKGRDSKVILTELKDFDENNVERSIIVAITLKRANRKNGYEINELSTVFKKNKSSKEGLTPEGDIIDWVNRTYKNGEPMHLLEYINKEKSLKWITSTGTTPKASNFIEAISNNIPDETDLVKLRNKKEYEGYYQTSTQNIEENIIPQKQVDTVRRQYEGTDKWLKAPNGKKSNLSETQWLQVRTPNFKKWFGDWENDAENASKVVDENGEPLVVYHGNPNAILNLETTLREKRTVFNVPFSVFRVDKGEGKTERGAFFHEKSAYPMYGFPSEFFLNLRNPATNERKAVFSLTDETVEKLIKDGYDGVIRDIGIGNSEIIAFNPEQIKSATDNRGTFDVNNRDIYYQTQPSGTRQEQAKFYEEFNNNHERPEYLNTGNVTTNINDYGNGVEIEFLGERANGISRSAQFPSGRKASQSEREGVIKYLLYDAIPELEMRIHDMFGGFPTVELQQKYNGGMSDGGNIKNLTGEQKSEIFLTAENLIRQIMGSPLSKGGRELISKAYGESDFYNNKSHIKQELNSFIRENIIPINMRDLTKISEDGLNNLFEVIDENYEIPKGFQYEDVKGHIERGILGYYGLFTSKHGDLNAQYPNYLKTESAKNGFKKFQIYANLGGVLYKGKYGEKVILPENSTFEQEKIAKEKLEREEKEKLEREMDTIPKEELFELFKAWGKTHSGLPSRAELIDFKNNRHKRNLATDMYDFIKNRLATRGMKSSSYDIFANAIDVIETIGDIENIPVNVPYMYRFLKTVVDIYNNSNINFNDNILDVAEEFVAEFEALPQNKSFIVEDPSTLYRRVEKEEGRELLAESRYIPESSKEGKQNQTHLPDYITVGSKNNLSNGKSWKDGVVVKEIDRHGQYKDTNTATFIEDGTDLKVRISFSRKIKQYITIKDYTQHTVSQIENDCMEANDDLMGLPNVLRDGLIKFYKSKGLKVFGNIPHLLRTPAEVLRDRQLARQQAQNLNAATISNEAKSATIKASTLTKEEREVAKSESFKRWLGFDWETGKLTAFDFLQPTEEELNRRANKLAKILDKNGEPKSEVIRDYQIHQAMSELYNKREKELLLKEKELFNKYVLRTEEAEKEDKEVGILTVKNGKTEQKFKVIRTQKNATSRVGRIDGANLDIRNKKGEVIATYFPYGKATLEFIRSQESKMGSRNQWKRSFINAFNNNLNQYLRAGDFLDANGNLVKDGNEAFRERWDKRTQEAIENNIDSGFYDNKIYPEDFESRELYERVKAEIDAAKAVKYSMDTPFGTVEIDNETGKPVLSDNEQINARTSWPKNTSSAETQSLVEFFTTANASTGFHEFAHHVLRVLTDAAQLENASDVLINDIKTIFKSAGVKQEDFYNDIGTARQDAQEYFAKSFEAYLHKGQAPTKELQSSFDRIKQWLVDVYQNIKESLGFELNEEMQDIFDRLLATPEQLAEQKSISDIETLYAATEGEIQLLQKEINDLEAQLLANSQAWEKTTEKAYVKGEKQGRKTQKEIDKVKFADKITKLKQRQKEMKERQHERQNIKKKVAKLVKNINRMAEAQNVDWFRQQDIKNLLDTYDTAKLRSLNLQDIEYLHNQVKEIYETGKRELAQKRLAKQKYIEQARRELAEPLRKDWENRPKGVATSPEEMGKQYKGVKGRIQKILDWTTAKTLGAQIFFDYLDGYKHNKGAFSKYFLDDVNEAYNTKLVHIYARLGAMEKAMARLGIKPKDLAKTREFSAPHRNGKNWTVEELIGIYAGLKNSKSRDAILFGNFSIAESYEQAEAWATEAVSKLSENEKALGDFIIQEYEENFERINNALVKVWNKGMKHEENYTPIRRLEVTSSNGGMINPDAAAEALINPNSNGSLGRVERGFSQSRVNFRQKTQPGMNLKIVSVWYSQVEAQEHAAAFGGVVQNLRRILLGKGKDSEASIYKMIRETRGKYAAEMIKQYFNIAATNETMQAYNLLDDIAKFLAKNMSIAYLCGNMGTALKQFNSFFFAVPYTSPTAMINNFIKATTNWKKFSEECFRLDPQLKARNGDPFIQELRKVKSIVYDNLLKWGSTPIGFMDRFTSCVVFKSVYDSNLRQGLSQNDAIKEAQRVVLLTQPPAHAKDKSLIWQQHGYARLAMMFTNSLSNIYGITMYELTQAIRNGEVPRAFTTAIGLTLAAMYITALTSGGPDEPDDPEEWAKWTASAFTEQTINSIPLIGKEALALWDYRRGYFKNDSAFIAPFAKLAAGTRGLWDDKSDNDERAIWNLIEGGSLLAPFPSTALHRLYNVGKELGEGEIGAALKRMVGINKEEKRIKKAVSY